MDALRIAFFSVDPRGLSAFDAFDPDSFSLITTLNDALIHIDEEGAVRPALAKSWKQLSPLALELQLREGVRFHNGEPFDAQCVVETFRAHREPTPSPTAAMLSIVETVRATGPHTVVLETAVPDPMLLWRLFFSPIYPKGVLAREGRDAFRAAPIGTGAYRLAAYDPGCEILLERNRDHWAARATVDRIRLPIIRQMEWLDRLEAGDVDVAWNLDSHDRVRASRLRGVVAASREAAVSQLFLLANQGPLADRRVRLALNHAVQRRLLVELTEHSFGAPQRSLATREEQGYVPLEAHRYSPEIAKRLLAEAGYADGFTLRGIVSETSTALFFAVKEFLARVNVRLEAEIVPRSDYFRRTGPNADKSGLAFALVSIDNPIVHSLFHHYMFLSSRGPFSLAGHETYDAAFAATATDAADPAAAQARLERHVRDDALLLFTVQQNVHAAWREGVSMTLPRSGHFDASSFWNIRVSGSLVRAAPRARPVPHSPDIGHLLESTSHAGTFYMRPGVTLADRAIDRIWQNICQSEKRWHVQNEPMLQALVNAVDAKASLSNVLGSTDRVVVAGYTTEGRRLFTNRGYDLTFGTGERTLADDLELEGPSGWRAIREVVDREGSWLGPVVLPPRGRPRGAPSKLFLAVTSARDDEGERIGYTFVFTDHTGEEERVRTAATRTILENVPYGLLVIDAKSKMQSGYSESCRSIFEVEGNLEGLDLADLLRFDARASALWRALVPQVFGDLLPSEVTLAQLPSRVMIGRRSFALQGSVIRDDTGEVSGILFTVLDISALVAAERESATQRATVLVLTFHAAFEAFVRELDASLRDLSACALPDQSAARATLHTAKGVLAQFSLVELSQRVHALEDRPEIDSETLRELRADVRALLDRQRDVWKIDLDAVDATLTVKESALRSFARKAAALDDARALRNLVEEMVATLSEKSVAEILGPVADTAAGLARRRGKNVRLVVNGGEERVPIHCTGVLTSLAHLVRNSIDHGVELPEDRGPKPEIATIAIDVRRDDRALRVDVADDGRGIDVDAIAERACEMGFSSREQIGALTSAQKLALVFTEGLSTASALSETSGRGVGARAVKDAVESHGGVISLSSEPGKGTRFSITLPM